MRKLRDFEDISSGFALAAVLFGISLLAFPSLRTLGSHLRQSASQSPWNQLVVAPQHPVLLLVSVAVGMLMLWAQRMRQFAVRFVSSVRARTVKIHRLIWLCAFYSCFLCVFEKWFSGAAACLIVGTLAHLVFRPQRPTSASRLPDDPIEFEEEDLLYRGSILQTLEGHIEAETPVVALAGDFGDGKTSVLRMLEKRLEKRSDIVSLSLLVPGYLETARLWPLRC